MGDDGGQKAEQQERTHLNEWKSVEGKDEVLEDKDLSIDSEELVRG